MDGWTSQQTEPKMKNVSMVSLLTWLDNEAVGFHDVTHFALSEGQWAGVF